MIDLTKLSTQRLLQLLKKVRKSYFSPSNEYDEANIHEEEYNRLKEELSKREHLGDK